MTPTKSSRGASTTYGPSDHASRRRPRRACGRARCSPFAAPRSLACSAICGMRGTLATRPSTQRPSGERRVEPAPAVGVPSAEEVRLLARRRVELVPLAVELDDSPRRRATASRRPPRSTASPRRLMTRRRRRRTAAARRRTSAASAAPSISPLASVSPARPGPSSSGQPSRGVRSASSGNVACAQRGGAGEVAEPERRLSVLVRVGRHAERVADPEAARRR